MSEGSGADVVSSGHGKKGLQQGLQQDPHPDHGGGDSVHGLGFPEGRVAELLGLTRLALRTLARDGGLTPRSGPGGQAHYSFQDLAFLRQTAGVPRRRLGRVLRSLRAQLGGEPLSSVRLSAEGRRIVARGGGLAWEPTSSQVVFDFTPAREGAVRDLGASRGRRTEDSLPAWTADEWYRHGLALEDGVEVGEGGEGAGNLPKALEAFRQAVTLDPHHADARIDLGRLVHGAGDPAGAEAHYRAALEARPGDPIATFNLGVAREDQGRLEEALDTYLAAIALDAACPDAHFNTARLYERLGDRAAALRHLATYRRLTGGAA